MDTILQLDQNILLFIQEYIVRLDGLVLERNHTSWRLWNFWILLTIVLLIPKKTEEGRACISACNLL